MARGDREEGVDDVVVALAGKRGGGQAGADRRANDASASCARCRPRLLGQCVRFCGTPPRPALRVFWLHVFVFWLHVFCLRSALERTALGPPSSRCRACTQASWCARAVAWARASAGNVTMCAHVE